MHPFIFFSFMIIDKLFMYLRMVAHCSIHLHCVSSAGCLQLLRDSQMSRRSFKKWPLTLQPMKWLHTWPSGTRRYVWGLLSSPHNILTVPEISLCL